MPDSAAGGHSPQTLKSGLRSLKGEVANRMSDQPPRVLLELRPLGRGVAVAEDQEVDLARPVAALHELHQRARARRHASGSMNMSARVDQRGPHLAKGVLRVALLRRRTCTGAAGIGNRSDSPKVRVTLLGLAGRLPLAVDGREAARVEEAVRRAGRSPRTRYLPRFVSSIGRAGLPGPGQRLEHQRDRG